MKNILNNIHKEFKQFKKDDHDIEEIYKKVRKEYLSRSNLDLGLEKVYLSKKFDNYKGETLNGNINMVVTMFITIATISIEEATAQIPNVLMRVISLVTAIVAIFYITNFLNKKIIKKEINEKLYYTICLEVINELENLNTKKRK